MDTIHRHKLLDIFHCIRYALSNIVGCEVLNKVENLEKICVIYGTYMNRMVTHNGSAPIL